jgi:hypothetical protein
MQTRVRPSEVLIATICASPVLYEDPDSPFSYGLSCNSSNIPYLLGFFDAVNHYKYSEGSLCCEYASAVRYSLLNGRKQRVLC